MKKIQSNRACLKTILFSACALSLATTTSVSAAPSVYQDTTAFSGGFNDSCYHPDGMTIIPNCAPLVVLLDKPITDPLFAIEQGYDGSGFFAQASEHVCLTLAGSDEGITGGSYDSLMPTDLLSSLTFVAGGESVSQTSSVRENDLATTPTICTRKDDTVLDTYYMSVFPPLLRMDQLLISVGSFEPANTNIPATSVEVTCQGSDTYAECEAQALAAYTLAYGADAVPLLLSTTPEDNEDAVDPEITTLTMTFNEPITDGGIGGSNAYLKRLSDGSIVETFSASSTNVVLDATGEILTATLSNPLDEGTDYYVEVEMGTIGSQATFNTYPGITFNDTWNFTTNSYPVLANASVTGAPIVFSTLTATPGTFSDPDMGDTAGQNMFQWFSGTDNTCNAYANPIAGATMNTYMPVAADVGQFICASVTPEDNHGLRGEAVFAVTPLAIVKAVPTITFNDPADVIYSSGLTFSAPATSSNSAVPVSLAVDPTSSSPGVCTVSGNTVTVVTAGNCDLITSQVGDASYGPAASKFQTVVIAQAAQTVTFADPADVAYVPGLTFSAPASSDSGLPVAVGSTTTGICTVAGNTVTVLSSGVCSLVAAQSGDTNYQAASAVTQDVTISQAAQTVTFADPADVTYSPGLTFSAPASSTSGLAVTVGSTSTGICTVAGNTVTVVSGGVCSLVASQNGDANYQAASAVTQTVTIAQATQAVTIADPSNATSAGGSTSYSGSIGDTFSAPISIDSGLAVTLASSTPAVCTVLGTTVTVVSAGTCTLSATQAGNANYAPVTTSRSVTISTTVDVTGVTETGGGGSIALLELLLGFGFVSLLYRRRLASLAVSNVGGEK